MRKVTHTLSKTAALTGLLASVMLVANTAQAAIFTVDGVDYDITTITGSYNDNVSRIQTTSWWGNSTLSSSLASTVGVSLGLPNGIFSAFFAYNDHPNVFFYVYSIQNGLNAGEATKFKRFTVNRDRVKFNLKIIFWLFICRHNLKASKSLKSLFH